MRAMKVNFLDCFFERLDTGRGSIMRMIVGHGADHRIFDMGRRFKRGFAWLYADRRFWIGGFWIKYIKTRVLQHMQNSRCLVEYLIAIIFQCSKKYIEIMIQWKQYCINTTTESNSFSEYWTCFFHYNIIIHPIFSSMFCILFVESCIISF